MHGDYLKIGQELSCFNTLKKLGLSDSVLMFFLDM